MEDDLHDHACVVVTREGWIPVRTPEGKEKQQVKEFLKRRRVQSLTVPLDAAVGFYWMPVPGGYGTSLLDFVICYRGFFIAVETKRLGDKPTPRQQIIIDMIEKADAPAVWGDAAGIIVQLTKLFDNIDRIKYAIDP